MKPLLYLSISLLFFLLSCNKDDDNFGTGKVALNFAVREGAVQENDAEGTDIDITFVNITREAGTVDIAIESGNAVYQTDYVTTPEATGGAIKLNIPANTSEISFKVNPVDVAGKNETKTLIFTLTDPTGGVGLGSSQTFTLFISDEPVVLLNAGLTDFGEVEQESVSDAQTYNIEGVSLVEDVLIEAPLNFEVSLDGSSFSSSVAASKSTLNASSLTVSVRFAPILSDGTGFKSGEIIHTSAGAMPRTIEVSGTAVTPVPRTLLSIDTLPDFGTVKQLEFSGWQSYTVEGSFLVDDLQIGAPVNWEVGLDTLNFSPSLTFARDTINAETKTVYVRFAPADNALGPVSGSITHTSAGAGSKAVFVSGNAQSQFITVLAFTSFEEVPLGISPYLDTENNDVAHDLINHTDEDRVDFTGTGGEMGFDATFVNTRVYTTPLPLDEIGAVGDVVDVGAFSEGNKGYKIADSEGTVRVTFDAVDLTGFPVAEVRVDMFIKSTSYETTPNNQTGIPELDKIRIYVIGDGGTEFDLFNQSSTNIEPFATAIWETWLADLSGNTTATLVIEVDTNTPTEGAYFDNIIIEGQQ